ncbi:protein DETOXIFICATION 35-like isoform X2 [Cucurbita pepo subsp. pepo]|uniref:protein DETOXIFICATION 35-like isoform X2 n=1 Tax=Cucurbita pepo subsp. pepo TaxID=3664 RepID=UPI000C9D4F69|nr:protein DETOXIFICATION 35-like isoform X2 [Cucurbita pepo subsp. pepo]
MEAAPLLSDSSSGGDYAPARTFKQFKRIVWSETVKTWTISGAVIFQIVCQYGTNSVTNIFVGQLGELELSGVSIAISVIATFAFGFMFGMGSATETLCGQAFGAGQIHMLGVYMQRSWVIMFVCALIITPVYVFATPILKLLGQQDDVAELAGNFSLLILPQLFSFVLAFPTQKFLQAQSKVWALAWIGFGALLAHVFMLWLFIFEFGWSTTGAGLALNISGWGLSIAQVIYVMGWCRDAWQGFSWLAFKDLWGFVKLSFSSAIMFCLEIWYMSSIIVLAGHLPNAVISVDSLSICMNLNGWENIIFIGINVAMSVRVSNELGKARPRAAKYSVYVTIAESLILGLLFMVLIFFVKDHFAVIFTSSVAVRKYVAKLAYLLGITMVLNSVQPVISGVAIGAGWQALVAYINLGCYYIFGLPLGIVLGYVAKFGVKGLWSGMIAGIAMQTILLLLVLYKTNWNKEVEETSGRMQKWTGQDIGTERRAES